MQIARSLVFQWNPVGGLNLENKKISPVCEKLIGCLPNSVASDEYDEIGILKLVNDSNMAIIIWAMIKKDKVLNIVLRFSTLLEKEIKLSIIIIPQIMYVYMIYVHKSSWKSLIPLSS
mgnify:CR=1 FL=1